MATYELIETIEVTNPSGQAELEFTVIDQSYTDLQIQFSGRVTRARVDTALNVQFNGDTGPGNYAWSIGVGDGSTKSATKDASDPYMVGGYVNGASATSDVFSSHVIDIADYTGDDKKIITVQSVAENNATSATQCYASGQWTSTNGITSIKLTELGGGSNFVQYTKASLYGIRKRNTSTAPKATGGIISFDSLNNKWAHTFTSSGTFTPTESLTAEVLLVAGGGGGGGKNTGGGGGAGGHIYSASESFSVSAYTATVGAGGALGGNTFNYGGNGGASSLTGSGISLTSPTGGGGGAHSTSVDGLDGGSGGGASNSSPAFGGSGIAGQGNNGGDFGSVNGGSGGGGAGSAGSLASGLNGGAGGSGINTYSALTTGDGNGYLMGGGAGGGNGNYITTRSLGGGGTNDLTGNHHGLPGTGSGGGGFTYPTDDTSGNGGSGIVIVRYAA